jgi:hypothetical protein
MKVIKPGTKINSLIGNIQRMISEVNITFKNKVIYKVEYFWDEYFKHIWLQEEELIIDSRETKTIGFK